MKFNHKLLSLSLGAALMTFTACTDDKLTGEDNSGTQNGTEWTPTGKTVYLSTGINLPVGNFGRSSTDGSVDDSGNETTPGNTNSDANPDFEYGHAYENEVNNILLIFTNAEHKYVAQSVIKQVTDAAPEAPDNGKFDFSITAELSYDELQKAYKDGLLGAGDDKIVHIYAFCNYTSRMYERFQDLAKTETGDPKRTEWKDWEGLVEEDPSPAWEKPTITNSIWSRGSFTMTNAAVADFVFPESIDDWEPWTDRNKPYIANSTGQQYKTGTSGDRADPTPIKVERVSARIDFKDGSTEGDNTYPIKVSFGEDDTKEFYNIKLTRMSLVNMNKKYYYLRRVSRTGLNASSQVGGVETSTNFVVDYFADVKKDPEGINTTNAHDYFNFPLYGKTQDINDPITYDRTQWYSNDIVDILDNNDQTDMWGTTHNYKIWRYVTENTIPTVDQQKTIQSTGIIFKGAIHPGQHLKESGHVSPVVLQALEDGAQPQPTWKESMVVLYDYQNILYGSIAELVDSANTNGANSPLYNKVYRILRHWKYDEASKTYTYHADFTEGLPVEVADRILNSAKYEAIGTDTLYNNHIKNQNIKIDFEYTGDSETFKKSEERPYINNNGQFMALCAEHDITVFIPSNEQDTDGWGYYCYYPYWIRHNDNNRSGMMGTMEFAVVRNNVYKLSVSNITKFGHPRISELDPDPVHPEDPDEDPTVYITVQVEVLPWVVRVNEIEF